MRDRTFYIVLVAVNLLVLATVAVAITLVLNPSVLGFVSGSGGQSQCRTFAETGKSTCGRFLSYWLGNGGLPRHGFPLSGEFQEVSSVNGKVYTVQYFERSIFESHPENK